MPQEYLTNLYLYDQARANREYWQQWARNYANKVYQICLVCDPRDIERPPVHLRDQKVCLDCHGELWEIAVYAYKCRACDVLHGWSGGNSSPYARFHRSGLLRFQRGAVEYDFSGSCKLSSYEPFQRLLARRSRNSA